MNYHQKKKNGLNIKIIRLKLKPATLNPIILFIFLQRSDKVHLKAVRNIN